MTVFIIVLCLINIGLWFLFLYKFKDLFNTDKIIEKTRYEMDKLVKDINNNAQTDIDLIDERIRKLRVACKEADAKLETVETRLSLLNKQLQDNQKSMKKASSGSRKSAGAPVNESQAASRYIENNGRNVSPDSSFSVTKDGKKVAGSEKTLFDEDKNISPVIDTRVQINVQPDGSSYAEIPVVDPKGFQFEVIENQNQSSESIESEALTADQLRNRVVQMYNQGIPADKIASSLSISTSEVQFIIDLN